MAITSVSSVYLCPLTVAGEDGTTALLSMSLEAFEHSLRTMFREVLSQYPVSSTVERPWLERPAIGHPPSVFGVSMPGCSSVGSGRELSSVLEMEPSVGALSSMPDAEGAGGGGVGVRASPVRSEEPGRHSPSAAHLVRASPSK